MSACSAARSKYVQIACVNSLNPKTLYFSLAFIAPPDPPANELQQLTPHPPAAAHPPSFGPSRPPVLLPPSINLYAPIIPLCEKRSKTALPPLPSPLSSLLCRVRSLLRPPARRIQFHTFGFPPCAADCRAARTCVNDLAICHSPNRSTQNAFDTKELLSLPLLSFSLLPGVTCSRRALSAYRLFQCYQPPAKRSGQSK